MMNSTSEPVYAAEVVVEAHEPRRIQVQVPENVRAGENFIFTADNGQNISVNVPEGVKSGSFIEVVVADAQVDEIFDGNDKKPFVRLSKATFGAAVVGIVVGTIILGPIGGIVIGGACAYATTREHGEIGEYSRQMGNKVYEGMVKMKKFVMKLVKKSGNSPPTTKGVAYAQVDSEA